MSVIVYIENRDGRFTKQGFELISYAKALTDQAGGKVTAITSGNITKEELQVLGEYGALFVVAVNGGDAGYQAVSAAIAQLAGEVNASMVVFASSIQGKTLAPELAARLNAGIVSGVSGLPVSYSPFVVPRKAYSGKVLAHVQVNTEKKVLMLATNNYGVHSCPVTPVIEFRELPSDVPASPFKIIGTEKQTGKILLSDAEIVVSAGRGMKSPDNWGGVEELASILGAATACSRPVSDEGWRPHSEHVGQTGKVINPNLYIALGISGAIQHVAGISGSKVIVAVNKDPEAPIFSVADYGIVGDVNQVLPRLIDAARQLKSL